MPRQIINSQNYQQFWESTDQTKGEVNNQPSKTIPGMTLSLRELVERYTMGAQVETFKPEYSEEDFSQFDNMDKLDKLEIASQIRQQINHHRVAHTIVDQQQLDEPDTQPVLDQVVE